jgi:gluconolactonase
VKVEVFDERRNVLGEGPSSSGLHNQVISWVDIYGRKVRTKDILSGLVEEFDTAEDVGFAIPRASGGFVVGEVSGPLARDADGTLHSLPNRESADGYIPAQVVRWNDAKVSPSGDLYLGTMAYDFKTNAGALYQLRSDGKHIRRVFGDVSISNGLGWNVDGSLLYYIDTALNRVDVFDVEEREIKNRRTLMNFSTDGGSPDGMCVDAAGNLWVAFWLGHAVRCYDGNTGALLQEILCPAPRITSCTFGGEQLDQLFITSASEDTDLTAYPEAGMVFITNPGVIGQKTAVFGA